MPNLRLESLIIGISGLLLFSCASLRPVDRKHGEVSPRWEQRRASLVKTARKYLGVPYRYGGDNGRGFDCSGLVHKVFLDQKITLPRSARAQSSHGQKVGTHLAKPADLAFFSVRGKVDHVALVTSASHGELWVIHSTTSRGVVHEEVLGSSYWSKRLREVRDVLD